MSLGKLLFSSPKAFLQEHAWVRLVSRVAARDKAALLELFDASYQLVLMLALRITGRSRSAEDVTVDVFEAVWHRAAQFDAEPTVLAWIMAMAQSMATERARHGHEAEGVDDRTAPARKRRPQDASLRRRLNARIAAEPGSSLAVPEREPWLEPKWEIAGPGIEYKMMAVDSRRRRVSMLVRLSPGAAYPAHTHADSEELHLLHGELWIDDRKLLAGDYNRAEAGTMDHRVWSATGCTCVLITSTEDKLH